MIEELLVEANYLGEDLVRTSCSQDHRLHLCLLHQPYVGTLSRQDQGVVGMNPTADI